MNTTNLSDAKDLQTKIGDVNSMGNIDISSDEIKSVLRRAQEMLKNKDKLSQTSPIKESLIFNNSNDILLVKNEAAKNLNNSSNNDNGFKTLNRKSSNISLISTSTKTNRNRTNSNVSINTDEITTLSNTNTSNNQINDLDKLREENELLNIKINKLRYELKSRDQTVEDLKSNISQMYVNLENSQMALKHTQLDIETLKADVNKLNAEKLNYYDQLKKSLQENEDKNKKLQQAQLTNADLNLSIEKLRIENETLNKQCIDVKMKSLKEKEELVKHLEKIEQEIIQRERTMFNQQCEKLLIESCEKIRAEDTKQFNLVLMNETDKIRQKYENEIKLLKERQFESQKQLEEHQKVIMATYNKDLNQQFEMMSETKLNEFLNEKKQLENKMNDLKHIIDSLNVELNNEKTKSNEKSNELINLNKQKFKLMAQLKQYQREDHLNKTGETAKNDELLLKYENLLSEFNELKKKEIQLIEINSCINKNSNLEKTIKEMQHINQNLNSNLNEWSSTNKNIEIMILNEQELNTQLIQNLNEWKISNQQLEESIIETQQIGENLKFNIQKLKQDSEILKEECISVKNSQPNLCELTNNFLNEKSTNTDDYFLDKENQIELLTKLNSKLENDYNNLDTSKLQLECDVIALKNDLEIINEKNLELENQYKFKYDKMVKQKDDEIKSLNEVLQTCKKEIVDLKAENEQYLKEKISNQLLLEELSSKKDEIIELNNKLNLKTSNETHFESRLKQNLERIDQISTEFDSYKLEKNHQIETLQNEIANLKEETQLIQQHKDAQLKDLTHYIEDLNEQSTSLSLSREKEFQNIISKNKNLEELKQDLEVQVNNLISEVESLKKINSNLDCKLISYRKENIDLIDQLNEKELENKTLESSQLNLFKENESFKSYMNKLEQDLHESKQHIEKLQEELQETNKLNQFTLSITEENYLSEQIESLNHKLNSIDEIRQQIESQNVELFSELESFKSESICSNSSYNNIKSLDPIQVELDSLRAERDDLLTKNSQLEMELNEAKKNFDLFLQGEKTKMQSIINELEENIKELYTNQIKFETSLNELNNDKLQIQSEKQNIEIQLKNEMEIRKCLIDKYESDKLKVVHELNEARQQIVELNNQLQEVENDDSKSDSPLSIKEDLSKVSQSSLNGSNSGSKINRRKMKKNYIIGLENQIETLNGEVSNFKNLILIYKNDNESLKQELLNFKNNSINDTVSVKLERDAVRAKNENTSNKELVKKLSQIEMTNKELEEKLINLELKSNKENELQSDLIKSLQTLVCKLELEQTSATKTYENLIRSQKLLISKLETRYNDVLNYLFDEMMEGQPCGNRLDEIQNDFEKLNEQSYNENIMSHNEECDGFLDDSLDDSLDFTDMTATMNSTRRLDNVTQLKELFKQYTQNKCKMSSASFEELNFNSEPYFIQFLKENIKQEELINNYFNNVNNFKDLVNIYVTNCVTNDAKLTNLKNAYSKLLVLYESFKQESFTNYNKLHMEYLKLTQKNSLNINKNTKIIDEMKLRIQPKAYCSSTLHNTINDSYLNDMDLMLHSEILQNEILKRQIKELEIQIDLANIKIINLSNEEEKREKEILTIKETNDLILQRVQYNSNELVDINKKLIKEIDLLKQELSETNIEKLELENTIEDLKQTLKLTEKESQHIRAKLLKPDEKKLATRSDLKAIMPPTYQKPQNLKTIDSFENSEILNDFAIDVTHIEKVVQDTDLIIIEKKPLEGVQSCLKSLRDQMSELQQQVCESIRTSTTWKYKLGFTCEKCEMKWEVEHQIKDNNSNINESDEFLQSSITQQLPKCNCVASLP